jgi:hypothetical protein
MATSRMAMTIPKPVLAAVYLLAQPSIRVIHLTF